MALRRTPRWALSRWVGPLAVVLVIALLEGLRVAGFRVPNPPALLLPLVVLTAFWSGLPAGLSAAAVVVLYDLFAFSIPGQLGQYTRDDLWRVVIWALTTPGTAWGVGWLRSRLERVEQAALEASEERFSKVFGASPLAMAVISLDQEQVLHANDALLGLLGWPPGVRLTTPFSSLVVRDPAAPRPDSPVAWRAETVLRAADGRAVTTLASFERIEFEGQTCLLGFFYDLSERLRLEENLRQAQKMEAIGRLAGGIAHDFNNLLTVINGNAAMLVAPAGASAEDQAASAKDILDAGERAAALTRELLAFSRKQPLRLASLSLNDVVASAAPLLRRLLPANVELDVAPADGLDLVSADRSQLDQVLLNLVTNARDAMPGGGRVTIATSNVEHGGAPFACLAVTDTGTGIDAAARPHLFEPFFTTRPHGKGTGLGLATVYAVVNRARGELEVHSELGRGSTFRVLLPRASAPADAAPVSAAVPLEPGGGGQTILVAEDEPAVRAVAVRTLRAKGYAVLEAGDGTAALAVAAAHAGPIHLLLSDVMMPSMNGRQLAVALRALRPGLRVLFMSGHVDDAELNASVSENTESVLPKPFTPEVLGRAVREALLTPGA